VHAPHRLAADCGQLAWGRAALLAQSAHAQRWLPLQAMPDAPKGVRRSRSAGPLAANLGRDNGQRSSSERGGSARLSMVRSPGMVDSEALLRSLYSA
jgi:hypothetical protein